MIYLVLFRGPLKGPRYCSLLRSFYVPLAKEDSDRIRTMWDSEVKNELFMNECIDSTMDHIHVCLLCLLLVTIRGLVVTIGVRFGFLHMEHTTTSRNVLKKRLILASFQLKSTNTL